MKKIKYLLLLMFMFGFINKVDATSASIKVSANNKTIIVGNTFKVNVKVSSSDLGSWEYCVSYDSDYLKLTSSTADANSCVKAGVVASKGQTSSTETFTFKAIKSGSSKISVKSYAVYGYVSEEQMKTSISSISIKSMTQTQLESTYSKDADLKSLSVSKGVLSPSFNKDTLNYKVEVDNEVDSITIKASKHESHQKITGTGEKKLSEGNNKIEIKVTAQKGNTKTYIVNVYRKELNPISVTINEKEYTIVRKDEDLPTYKTYTKKMIDYENEMIPALYSEITGITLLALKDEDGNILTFTYDNIIGDEYYEVNSASLSLYPQSLPDSKDFKEFITTTTIFNGKEIPAYKVSEDSKQAIIYALNVETGDRMYYLYDEEDAGLIRYIKDIKKTYEDKNINNKDNKYMLIIYSLIGVIVLLVIILIVVAVKKKSKVYNMDD